MADPVSQALATRLMTEGGDARIRLDPTSGLNRYFSAPRPSGVLAYASSTANDISPGAFAHVLQQAVLIAPEGDMSGADYARQLERLRSRIRAAYAIASDVDIVFAPSGTDLEYVALACTAGRAPAGTHNVLLGADEVGSGCIYSAFGQYFAESTALGVPTRAGQPVAGLGETHVDMIDVPVRDADGYGRRSAEIADAIRASLGSAAGRHPLIHVVHGSKTGLILPGLGDIDALRAERPTTFVVDACQARITPAAIAAYLDRGAIVFITGSKFMGGPPFSGFALIPPALAAAAQPLAAGFATLFRRAEWPSGWPGAEQLPDDANPGLLLRLEASIFELERFSGLSPAAAERVILAFHAAVRSEIVEPLGIRRVAPYPRGERDEADSHPIEMRTLSTLDLSRLGGGERTFEHAQGWHKALLGRGIRLGQPVKCVRLADEGWGATLRIGLTMWQVADRAALSAPEAEQAFRSDMRAIAAGLRLLAGKGS
ncbi:MAG TPA: hypothetical protein VF628_02775 [Allosphingosinicella sp.]|jgi:hypothetical protein